MLKGLDPLLDADMLHALRAMGHGDRLVLVDRNFPAHALAAGTVVGRPLSLPVTRIADGAAAILSLMPLDFGENPPAWRMQQGEDPDSIPPVQQEVQAEIDRAEGRPRQMHCLPRFDFYDRAADAFAIVLTGEPRFFGCFIFSKGVIGPDA